MPDSHWIIPDWPAPPGVHAAVTTRSLPGNSRPPFDAFNLGTHTGEDAGIVAANRAALQRALHLPSAPRWLRQVHGCEVAGFSRNDAPDRGEPVADAALTRDAGVVLAVLTADCLPLLFCAADGSVIAAVHAGWRGLAAGVIEATLAQLGVSPSQVQAWLGPAIAAPSYEVGDEVRDAFVRTSDTAAQAFAATRPGHWRCDLALLARQRLAAAGVAQVSGGGFDTAADARFYSHRRDTRTGRFATLVWRQTPL
jgi:YfiH family protein